MYHTMHELRELIKKQDWETITTHQQGWSTPHLVVVLTSISLTEQARLFCLLEEKRALDVFTRLKPAEQSALIGAMHHNEAVKLLDELEPCLRNRLADALPSRPRRNMLKAARLQAVWSIFA